MKKSNIIIVLVFLNTNVYYTASICHFFYNSIEDNYVYVDDGQVVVACVCS